MYGAHSIEGWNFLRLKIPHLGILNTRLDIVIPAATRNSLPMSFLPYGTKLERKVCE